MATWLASPSAEFAACLCVTFASLLRRDGAPEIRRCGVMMCVEVSGVLPAPLSAPLERLAAAWLAIPSYGVAACFGVMVCRRYGVAAWLCYGVRG